MKPGMPRVCHVLLATLDQKLAQMGWRTPSSPWLRLEERFGGLVSGVGRGISPCGFAHTVGPDDQRWPRGRGVMECEGADLGVWRVSPSYVAPVKEGGPGRAQRSERFVLTSSSGSTGRGRVWPLGGWVIPQHQSEDSTVCPAPGGWPCVPSPPCARSSLPGGRDGPWAVSRVQEGSPGRLWCSQWGWGEAGSAKPHACGGTSSPAAPEPPFSSTDWTDAEYSGLAHSVRACCGPGPGLEGWGRGIRVKILAFVGRQAVGKRNLSKSIMCTVESWG